jgi:hypothetical protein
MRRASIATVAVALFLSHEAKADDLPPLPPPEQPAPAPTQAPPPTATPAPTFTTNELPLPSSPAPTTPATTSVWYGLPILIIDVSSVVVAHVGLLAGSSGVVLLSGGVYLVGGPAVHFSRGNIGRGFGSFGLRLGMPVVLGLGGLVAGAALGSSNNNGDAIGALVLAALGGYVGGMLGIAGASTIDIAALARDDVPTKTQATWTLRPSTIYVQDTHSHRTPVLGVGGTF